MDEAGVTPARAPGVLDLPGGTRNSGDRFRGRSAFGGRGDTALLVLVGACTARLRSPLVSRGPVAGGARTAGNNRGDLIGGGLASGEADEGDTVVDDHRVAGERGQLEDATLVATPAVGVEGDGLGTVQEGGVHLGHGGGAALRVEAGHVGSGDDGRAVGPSASRVGGRVWVVGVGHGAEVSRVAVVVGHPATVAAAVAVAGGAVDTLLLGETDGSGRFLDRDHGLQDGGGAEGPA